MSITLMVQGTTSDAGKSTLVCGLARVFKRRGINVAPFKPQNMALNSAVTIDGGEIGRAQALQAQACGLEPICDFNPVLLKPSSDIGCQVIINGKVAAQLNAKDYHQYKPTAMKAVLAAHQRLTQQFDYVVVEGAGSPAEINLRERDIANMGFAEAVDCPVILIADIDRGGVFAHLTGTLACLSESEQRRVIGFVINRFRGDPALLTSGLDWLEQQTGKPVLAVLPYLQGLYLDSEDAVATEQDCSDVVKLNVVVPVYPRMSNHNDLDALRAHPQVNVQLVGPQLLDSKGQCIGVKPAADLLILAGSKNTLADLIWLKEQGWDRYIERHLRYGGKVLGICGGLQMLGLLINDPDCVESLTPRSAKGLGYLPIKTTFSTDKTLKLKKGQLSLLNQDTVLITGYEIHAGLTELENSELTAVLMDDEGNHAGYLSPDEQIMATYWHGLLDTPDALNAILTWASGEQVLTQVNYQQLREQSIDCLADSVEREFNWLQFDQAMRQFESQKLRD